MAEFVAWWLAQPGLHRDRRDTTLSTYESVIRNHVVPGIGDSPIGTIGRPEILAWLREVRDDMSEWSWSSLVAVTRAVMTAAVDTGVRESHPLAGYRFRAPKPRRDAMTADQLAALIASSEGDRTRVAWMLGGYLGLRSGEICGLTWDRIDWTRHEVTIDRQLHPTDSRRMVEPKTPRTAPLPLAPELVTALSVHRERQRMEQAQAAREGRTWGHHGGKAVRYDHVLLTDKGLPFSRQLLGYYFARALKAAGLPDHFTPHSLRHTTATLLWRSGIDPKVAQTILGHARLSTTMDIYTSLESSDLRTASQAISRSVGN